MFHDIEVMQQPSAFCDGIIIAWIAEMRKREGYDKLIVVRDMFAGGLSQSCRKMSVICGQRLSFMCGKMTPVMQLTDTAVAFNFKKHLEAVKGELRRKKREGSELEESAWLAAGHEEVKCSTGRLLRICALAWRRQVQHDEVEEPDPL